MKLAPEQIANYWITVGVVASIIFAALGFKCPYPVEEIIVEHTCSHSRPHTISHSPNGGIV